MKQAYAHEDEGTAHASPSTVIGVMGNAKESFPGIITAHQLARAINVVLSTKGFEAENVLLVTSFDGDEVCRDVEDELREVYGQNFNIGGIAGFPFGGNSAFGAMTHHVPQGGHIVIVYGPHVGIDHDGVIGKVNRRGHQGSGTCCAASKAALAYVMAVKEGMEIRSPDPSDPSDAQQVFVDSALMKHSDRLLNAPNPDLELPHAIFDCIDDLMKRIMDKCCPKDVPKGTKIALLGGVQINTPEGTPDYFLPKKFSLMNNKGEVKDDLLQTLSDEGTKDIKQVILEKRMEKKTAELKKGLVDVPIIEA